MNLRWLALTSLFLVLAPRRAAALPEASVLRFAVVIGNNEPRGGPLGRLRYADDDAVATHQLLLEAGVDSHLLVTLDDDTRPLKSRVTRDGAPSLRNLERVFAAVSSKMREWAARGGAAEFLLFYSGHGDVEHGEGFVVLEDGPLTRAKLFALLTRSPAAHNHVFIDACKSYFMIYSKGPGGTRSAYPQGLLGDAVPARLANTGFVLSTSSDRDSHEWEHYQAGILSYELRSALRGAADADLDGRIDYAELGAFLTVANQGIRNPKFKPDFLVRAPRALPKREILVWKSDVAALNLDSAAGHAYVETAEGERLLDMHSSAGTTVRLRVPPPRPLFVRRDDETAETVVTSPVPERIAALTPVTPEVARRGALHLAFRQLFSVPFGPANVREFERRKNEPRSLSFSEPASTSAVATVSAAAGWIAVAAAGGALTLNGLSLATYVQGEGKSQVETARANEQIHSLNLAAIVCYGVTGAAGLTWAMTHQF